MVGAGTTVGGVVMGKGGCTNLLFWSVVAGVMGVFMLLPDHLGWATGLLVVTLVLGIAHNATNGPG